MRLELSSPVRSHRTEQLGLCFVKLDLSGQQVVRQAHLEPWNYSALVALLAVLDNVVHISKQHEEVALLVLVAALTESAVPAMALAVEGSDRDVGGEGVVLAALDLVDSDSTEAAVVVPVDSS